MSNFRAQRGAKLAQVGAAQETDVRIWRDAFNNVHATVPWSVVWHSPDGFEVGYGGSGPADLALNILNAFVPAGGANGSERCYRGRCSTFAARHHQDFKVEFLAPMPREGGTITAERIRAWIAERRA
jgi:hypothetical protein